MNKGTLLAIALLIPLIITGYYYQFYDAAAPFNYQCGLYKMTGLLCPGCGGQRAYHHLLHGDFMTAFRDNLIFVLGLPILLYLYFVCIKLYIFHDNKYSNSFVFSSRFGYYFLAILFIFFIIRNVPISPFTYLTPP